MKRLVVLCLFVTGCTTIQQDLEDNAAREPAAFASTSAEDEPNAAVRAQAWEQTRAAFKAGVCPALDQLAPNAWRIFGQFAEKSPERKSLGDTLKTLMEGSHTTIRPLTAEEARSKYSAQTKTFNKFVWDYYLIASRHGETVLAVGPSAQPVACREVR